MNALKRHICHLNNKSLLFRAFRERLQTSTRTGCVSQKAETVSRRLRTITNTHASPHSTSGTHASPHSTSGTHAPLHSTSGTHAWSRSTSGYTMDFHTLAKEGYKQGDHYDKNRPTYTAETIETIARELTDVKATGDLSGLKYDVLELGAGTGIFTRKILEKLSTGTRFLATEPSEEFLQTLQKMSPGIDSKLCTANEIPLPDNSVKAVLCAQCFHWFATTSALQEIRRVLVQGGKLVLVWNMRDVTVPWVKEVEAIVAEVTGSDSDKLPTTFNWRKPLSNYSGFQNEVHQRMPGTPLPGTVESIVMYYSTFSMICALEEDQQKKTLERIRGVVEKSVTGEGNYPFNTEIFTYRCNKD